MNAVDGLSSRGSYSTAGGRGGSNGGPNITAASFAAAAAAAAASNGANSTSVTVPAMMMPGASTASSVQQQKPAAVAGVTWGEMVRSRKEYTLLKKVVQLLQDNRLKSGDEEAAEKLRELNRSQNESFPVLKTILNAIFITTGVVLLIAVVVVIIYTSLVKSDDDATSSEPSIRIPPSTVGPSSSKKDNPLSRSNRLLNTSSPSIPNNQGFPLNDGSPSQSNIKGAKICRSIAIEQEGENLVRIFPLCFHAPSTNNGAQSRHDGEPSTR